MHWTRYRYIVSSIILHSRTWWRSSWHEDDCISNVCINIMSITVCIEINILFYRNLFINISEINKYSKYKILNYNSSLFFNLSKFHVNRKYTFFESTVIDKNLYVHIYFRENLFIFIYLKNNEILSNCAARY